jgi:hypothetical protein
MMSYPHYVFLVVGVGVLLLGCFYWVLLLCFGRMMLSIALGRVLKGSSHHVST